MTSIELIHKWANKNFEKDKDYKSGSYSANNKSLYYNNTLIAYHNIGYIFVGSWSNKGSYGTGNSYSTIVNACPDKSKVIQTNILFNEYSLENKDSFLKWYKNEFIHINQSAFNNISFNKEFIRKNSLSANYFDLYDLKFDLVKLPKSILKLYKDDINKLVIDYNCIYRKHTGWSRNNYIDYPKININKTIKQLTTIKVSQLFSKKELSVYDFKIWRNKYVIKPYPDKGFYLDIKDSLLIYNDLDKRKVYEEQQELRVKNKKRQKEIKEKEERREKLKERFIKFNKWKLGDYLIRYTNNIGFQGLRQYKDQNVEHNIQTSFGVIISEKEAKRALDIFRRYEKSDKDIEIKNIALDGYPIKGIYTEQLDIVKDDNIIEVSARCLIVGCHIIPDFEIEDFLNRYKLNW